LQPLAEEPVRCVYCGASDVSRKSRQGRLKKYLDAQGQVQSVEVFRFYCHNPACSSHGSLILLRIKQIRLTDPVCKLLIEPV
jgi:hypothetical protein